MSFADMKKKFALEKSSHSLASQYNKKFNQATKKKMSSSIP